MGPAHTPVKPAVHGCGPHRLFRKCNNLGDHLGSGARPHRSGAAVGSRRGTPDRDPCPASLVLLPRHDARRAAHEKLFAYHLFEHRKRQAFGRLFPHSSEEIETPLVNEALWHADMEQRARQREAICGSLFVFRYHRPRPQPRPYPPRQPQMRGPAGSTINHAKRGWV